LRVPSVGDIEIDAVVLAEDPLARVRIAGLSACERAKRIAARVGATRVLVVDNAAARGKLADFRGKRTCPLLVIRADQLVHTPLVQPLIEAMPRDAGLAIAVVSEKPPVEDLTVGSYAGAFVATGSTADDAIAAIARGESETFVTSFANPIRVPHGAIARAPISTAAQRSAAHRLLYRILIKPQDNAITRYLYRPVSFPLTRLLVWTPITPNQISYLVAALVAFGCWVTAHASTTWAIAGTLIVLAASYIDCCDGEVARVKLLSSRFGAWIDTIVDELSSVGYMAAIGWHCHLAFGPRYLGELPFDPWIVAIAFSTVTYLWSIYCVYYNIIVAVGSANSQDYVGRFEVAPGAQSNSVRLRPAQPKAIATARELPPVLEWLATYAPYIVRRDFISWGTVILAIAHLTQLTFVLLVIGGVLTAAVVTVDHLKLRSLRRAITRKGLVLEGPRG
jgi:phosphatidylglycerophosphate synthase